ncbi:alpha-mannosidase 2-like [Ruditapes philippinarum]|uniref:alpha-mannosidase 2-like n=1 Tax=Ruditapes philippinarum TaxID=129788 RepID=UPI00295AF68A|nr:alpha-mannosidase 2-like [Ruditapes philippinarum]
MKTTARRIARCFPVFFTSKRKRTRRIVALFFTLLFLGIYFVLAQFEQTGLIGLKMSNTRTFASENSFSWDSVLDALEHTEEGDFLRYDKGKTKGKQTHDKLKVIVLLHSHNDPGYKYTYDQYYFNKTKHVLSLAVEKLMKYQDMTFIWTDTCFLDRIWKELSDEMKANLKYLVKTGRFEISLGAWVSADECVTHYYSYIDQLIEGYSWIRQHFDVFPNVSFNMDQFGTSSSIHYIRRKVGIRHSVYNHIHKGTKVFFRKNRLLEFNLKQSLINNMDSFVHVEPFDDLGFKGSCGPSAKICSKLALTKTTLSFDKSLPRNATSMDFAEQLVSQIRLKSEMYLHNVLFLPVGDDLVYITSQEWDNQYKNLKKLMQYINDKSKWKIDIQFGTLSQYFRELEKVASKSVKQFPTVSGDLFPYTRGPKYWSGYFTTRQFVKRLGRELQESVRATEMLIAFTIPNTIERIQPISNKV